MMLRKWLWPAVLTASLALIIAGVALATVTTIPASDLVSSTQYYTDLIGGGIGPVAVMNGGGNANDAGEADGRNDDGFEGPLNLGFTLNFFGTNYTQFWANNNGNISFGNGIAAFTPSGPQGASQPIISPFFADVDTRNAASGVMHVRTDIANEIIVTWDAVGYFGEHADKLDSFQLVLRGPNYSIPSGEGQVGFWYKTMQWETGDASGGSGGLGGTPAAVGFGDGQSNGFVLAGSTQNGIAGVVNNHHIWFNLVGGVPTPTPTPSSTPVPGTIWLVVVGIIGLGLTQWMRLRNRRA